MNKQTIFNPLPLLGSKSPDRVKSYPKANKVQENGNKPIKKGMRKVKLNPVSKKRAKANAIYAVERPKFLKLRVFCQIKRPECLGKATEVHHTYDGADRKKHFLEQETWLAACRVCHDWVHSFPKAAKALGFLK
jgi:hypothetical protein